MKERKNIIFVIPLVILIVLLSIFPLHHICSKEKGVSWEVQNLALFIVGEIEDIHELMESTTIGVHNREPALSFIVAFFYLLFGNMDIASLITTLMFSILSLFVFERLSKSWKLTLILMFVPYWLIASFSALPELSGIFFILLSLYLYEKGKYAEAIVLSGVGGLFRIEGFLVSLIMILYSRKWKEGMDLIFFIGLFLLWFWVVFGDPLILITSKACVAFNPQLVLQTVSTALSSGIYGVGKTIYITLILMVSVLTAIFANKRFRENRIYFWVCLTQVLFHDFFLSSLYYDYSRFFLFIVPFTLIVFKKEIEKWFTSFVIGLTILSLTTTFLFYRGGVI